MTQINKIIDGFNVIEYEKSCIYIIEDILETSFCDEVKNIIDILPLEKKVNCKGNNVECYSINIDENLL